MSLLKQCLKHYLSYLHLWLNRYTKEVIQISFIDRTLNLKMNHS